MHTVAEAFARFRDAGPRAWSKSLAILLGSVALLFGVVVVVAKMADDTTRATSVRYRSSIQSLPSAAAAPPVVASSTPLPKVPPIAADVWQSAPPVVEVAKPTKAPIRTATKRRAPVKPNDAVSKSDLDDEWQHR